MQGRGARIEDDPRHKIFKAYDIRGIYPDDLDEKLAERIGAAVARFLDPGSVVVSRDMRTSSDPLAGAVIQGLLTAGCDVLGHSRDQRRLRPRRREERDVAGHDDKIERSPEFELA